jgi:hypothetical protein
MDLRTILTEIREEHGKLTPAIVLEAATPEDHPLHHRFEWNDAVAGHKWRLHQAGNLLRCKIKQQTDGGTRNIRAFWPVRGEEVDGAEDPGADYTPIEQVAQDPVARQVMLLSMQREWVTMKRRYGFMAEFIDMIRSDLEGGDGDDGNGPEVQAS